MRRGFLLSEYCVALMLIATIGILTPSVSNYGEKIQWQCFTRQLHQLQQRALAYNKKSHHAQVILFSDTTMRLAKGTPITLPAGWSCLRPYHIPISHWSPKSGTVVLVNKQQRKSIVFQVGGGTFDIQG